MQYILFVIRKFKLSQMLLIFGILNLVNFDFVCFKRNYYLKFIIHIHRGFSLKYLCYRFRLESKQSFNLTLCHLYKNLVMLLDHRQCHQFYQNYGQFVTTVWDLQQRQYFSKKPLSVLSCFIIHYLKFTLHFSSLFIFTFLYYYFLFHYIDWFFLLCFDNN